MNVIASLGLKPKDLYKLTFAEFLKENPDLKKLGKEIQTQRYNFYEEERQNNVNRCIQERKAMIALTKKKSKIKLKKNNSDNIDTINYNDLADLSISNNKSANSIRNKRNNIKVYNEKNKKIFMTDSSYIMNNSDGSKALITKEDLEKITCLQNEKSKLEKKVEGREEHLMRFLKSELMREQKIQKVRNRISQKEKKINDFLKNKNDGIKLIENERYQDHQDVYERQKLYEKMLNNYDKKIYITKKQQQEQNKNSKTLNNEKMDELKEQIKDYEKKNKEFKQKISDIFDLKVKPDTEERKIREKKFDPKYPDLGLKKLIDLEEKLEIERYRRENALMTHINQFQNKINNILEKKEEKEKKIKKAIEKAEQKREAKRMLQSIHYEEVRNNVKKNQKNLEDKRNLKLQDLEKKDLKLFAIKQEKIKMYEERKKINQQNYEEREAMKAKLKEIFKDKKTKDSGDIENDDAIINKLLNN